MNMKISIDREMLLEKAQAVSKIILKKNVIAIYDHILFSVWTEGITLTASNGNTEIKTSMECKCGETFRFCVPSDVFLSTIKYMREQTIKLSYEEKVTGTVTSRVLTVVSGKSKYKIACEDSDVFPLIKTTTTEKEMLMDGGEFKEAMNTIEQFVPSQSDMLSFTGIHIKHLGSGQILIEGGDRASIGRAYMKARSLNGFTEVLVLGDAIPVDILDKSDKLNIYQHENALKIISDQYSIVTLLMNDKYPDTEKIFVTEPNTKINLNCVEVTDCVNRLKGYVGEAGAVSVEFGKVIVLRAADDGRNNHGEETIETSCPIDVATGFNPGKLSAIMNRADCDTVEMSYSGQKNPFFFTPAQNDSTVKYKFLLAPMTII